jgi:hypothetical protein
VTVRRANYDATCQTIRAMRNAGHLEGIDEAVVALARTTARNLDAADPGTATAATCARAHVVVLDRLRELTDHDSDDAISRMLDQFTGDAAVGDTEDT